MLDRCGQNFSPPAFRLSLHRMEHPRGGAPCLPHLSAAGGVVRQLGWSAHRMPAHRGLAGVPRPGQPARHAVRPRVLLLCLAYPLRAATCGKGSAAVPAAHSIALGGPAAMYLCVECRRNMHFPGGRSPAEQHTALIQRENASIADVKSHPVRFLYGAVHENVSHVHEDLLGLSCAKHNTAGLRPHSVLLQFGLPCSTACFHSSIAHHSMSTNSFASAAIF